MIEFNSTVSDFVSTPDGKVIFLLGVAAVIYFGWNAFATVADFFFAGVKKVKYNLAAYNADLAMDKYARLSAHGGTPHKIQSAKGEYLRLYAARGGKHFA